MIGIIADIAGHPIALEMPDMSKISPAWTPRRRFNH